MDDEAAVDNVVKSQERRWGARDEDVLRGEKGFGVLIFHGGDKDDFDEEAYAADWEMRC